MSTEKKTAGSWEKSKRNKTLLWQANKTTIWFASWRKCQDTKRRDMEASYGPAQAWATVIFCGSHIWWENVQEQRKASACRKQMRKPFHLRLNRTLAWKLTQGWVQQTGYTLTFAWKHTVVTHQETPNEHSEKYSIQNNTKKSEEEYLHTTWKMICFHVKVWLSVYSIN